MFEQPSRETKTPAYVAPQYAAHAAPAYPTYPPQQRKPNWLIIWGVVGVVALFAGLGVIGSAVQDKRDQEKVAGINVTVDTCMMAGGVATVTFTATNTGDKTVRSAAIDIEYRDRDGARVDTDTAYVRDVVPGQPVRVEEVTALDVPVTSGQCVITGVR